MRSKQFAITRGTLSIVAFAIVIAIGNTPASARRVELRRDHGPIAPSGAASAFAADEGRVLDDYAKLPVAFIENRGQVNARVRYYAQGNRFGFYLTQTEVVVALTRAGVDPGVALALRFLAANPDATIEAGDRAPGEVNYFRGSDPSQWHTRLARYGHVTYRNLWHGIDLVVREQSGVLKYEFHVRPGARPSDIQLLYRGTEGLSIDRSGALAIDTAAGVVHDAA